MKNRIFAILFLVTALFLVSCENSEDSASTKGVSDIPKYSVKLSVDCESNLLFSKYDVVIRIKVGQLSRQKKQLFLVNHILRYSLATSVAHI